MPLLRAQMFFALNRSCHKLTRLGAMTREQRNIASALFEPPGKNFMSGVCRAAARTPEEPSSACSATDMIGPHLLGQLAGILVMSMLCDHGVDVYGFDTGNEPPDTPYHYYDEGVPNNKLDEADDKSQIQVH